MAVKPRHNTVLRRGPSKQVTDAATPENARAIKLEADRRALAKQPRYHREAALIDRMERERFARAFRRPEVQAMFQESLNDVAGKFDELLLDAATAGGAFDPNREEIERWDSRFQRIADSVDETFNPPATATEALAFITLLLTIQRRAGVEIVPSGFDATTVDLLETVYRLQKNLFAPTRQTATSLERRADRQEAAIEREERMRDAIFGGPEWRALKLSDGMRRLRELKARKTPASKEFSNSELIEYLQKWVDVARPSSAFSYLFDERLYWVMRRGYTAQDFEKTEYETEMGEESSALRIINQPYQPKSPDDKPKSPTTEVLGKAEVQGLRDKAKRTDVLEVEQRETEERGGVRVPSAPQIEGIDPRGWRRVGKINVEFNAQEQRVIKKNVEFNAQDPSTYDLLLKQYVLQGVRFGSTKLKVYGYKYTETGTTILQFSHMENCTLTRADFLRIETIVSGYAFGIAKSKFIETFALLGVDITFDALGTSSGSINVSRTYLPNNIDECSFKGLRTSRTFSIAQAGSIRQTSFDGVDCGDAFSLQAEELRNCTFNGVKAKSITISAQRVYNFSAQEMKIKSVTLPPDKQATATPNLVLRGTFYGKFDLRDLQDPLNNNNSGSDFSDVFFDPECEVDLRGAQLALANFSGVTFYGDKTRFANAEFTGANFSGARFVGKLRKLDLREVDIEAFRKAVFTDATWDDTVLFPLGYVPTTESAEDEPGWRPPSRGFISRGFQREARSRSQEEEEN